MSTIFSSSPAVLLYNPAEQSDTSIQTRPISEDSTTEAITELVPPQEHIIYMTAKRGSRETNHPTLDSFSRTHFIVQKYDGTFTGYATQVEEMGDGVHFRFLVAPPILADGWVLYKKRLHKVTVMDILKRRFTASSSKTNNSDQAGEGNEHDSNDQSISETHQARPIDPSWIDDIAGADLAFKAQVDALQYLQDPETFGW